MPASGREEIGKGTEDGGQRSEVRDQRAKMLRMNSIGIDIMRFRVID